MYFRTCVVAPLMLAAVLNAQELPAKQGPDPAKQEIERLKGEKQRLEREIEYARERARNAKSRLANKLRRNRPSFRTIDAGKPQAMLSTMPKPVKRKPATVASPDKMKIGGGPAMVVVNRRGISEQLVNDVSQYLQSYSPQAKPALVAQRVLYDLIKIEGVAGTFVDNKGRSNLSQTLSVLQNGTMTFADAVQKYATVRGANEQGELIIARNSVLGPLFEFMAFSTSVGEISRPFLTPQGYAVLKIIDKKKGQQDGLDKVSCSVVLFKHTEDEEAIQEALYKVTSGQADVLVRDEQVLELLPGLYRPPAKPQNAEQQLMAQIRAYESKLKEIVSAGEGDSDRAQGLRTQMSALMARLKQLNKGQNDVEDDTADSVPQDSDAKSAIKRAPSPSKPIKKKAGGN